MTTDNRTNKPTEAQVEAAAKAAYEFDADVSELFGKGFRRDFDGMPQWAKDTHLDKARAALVAAQGAAPQAESKCQTCSREASFCAHCVAEMELAPVLPSSGVDEDKLAEVLEAHRYKGMGWCECGENVNVRDGYRRHVARAVAEWLKGQGGESRDE